MFRELFLVLLVVNCVKGQLDDEDFGDEVPSTHTPHILSAPASIQATMGETVNFPCEVDDLGVFVKLWKKGKVDVLFASHLRVMMDSRFEVVKNSLQISPVQPKDSGEYVCQISTNPTQEIVHTLNVLYPPTVKPRPRSGLVTAKEGESITLSCDANGNPEPKITWKHAGRHYDFNDEKQFSITNALKSVSGEYECIASNGIGEPASSVITVEVVSAPKVYPKPHSGVLIIKEGEDIEISCEATGDPLPVISWKTPGVDKAHKGRDGNRIIITEADRSHAGSYECIANNSLGIFTSSIIRVQVLFAPEIKVANSWIHAGEGSNINITCNIKGDPVPSVMWKRGDGTVIRSNEHYHLKTNGHHHTLQINHLKEDDFGRYECIASNSVSSVGENIHIIGVPQVPTFTSKPHGSHGSKYTLTWVVKSHSPIDEYSLIYRKKTGGEEWKTITIPSNKETSVIQTHMYELRDLSPATTYEAMVTARNKFGWSKQSDPFVFTTKHEVVIEVDVPLSPMSATADISDTDSSNEKHSRVMSSSSYCVQSLWLLILSLASLNLCFNH